MYRTCTAAIVAIFGSYWLIPAAATAQLPASIHGHAREFMHAVDVATEHAAAKTDLIGALGAMKDVKPVRSQRSGERLARQVFFSADGKTIRTIDRAMPKGKPPTLRVCQLDAATLREQRHVDLDANLEITSVRQPDGRYVIGKLDSEDGGPFRVIDTDTGKTVCSVKLTLESSASSAFHWLNDHEAVFYAGTRLVRFDYLTGAILKEMEVKSEKELPASAPESEGAVLAHDGKSIGLIHVNRPQLLQGGLMFGNGGGGQLGGLGGMFGGAGGGSPGGLGGMLGNGLGGLPGGMNSVPGLAYYSTNLATGKLTSYAPAQPFRIPSTNQLGGQLGLSLSYFTGLVPGDRYWCLGAAHSLQIVDRRSMKVVARHTFDKPLHMGAEFSSDGKLFAVTVSADAGDVGLEPKTKDEESKTVTLLRVHDTRNRNTLAAFAVPSGFLRLRFDPTGERLAVVDEDGRIELWKLPGRTAYPEVDENF